jgi:hypothetical protein
VPFDALADGEHPGLGIGVGLPGGGKPRIERPILPRIAEIFEGWLIGEHLAGIRGGDGFRILARVLSRKAKRAAALGLLRQHASRARDPEGRERHARHRGEPQKLAAAQATGSEFVPKMELIVFHRRISFRWVSRI